MVVSRRLLDCIGDAAGVEQREAAGAVGRLHHAGLDAGLPDRRRLLVARHAEHRHRRAEDVGRRDAELGRRCRRPSAASAAARPGSSRARRPRRPCGCRAAACGWRWSRRSHGPCRRSGATAGSSRSCRPPARPSRPRPARRRRSAGSRRSWCRRNRDRAAGRSSARRSSRGRRASARRTCPRCGGPARRWRCAPACRCARSHTTVVSRWLVMPMPAMSLAVSLALASAPRQTSTVARQISSGSCSTQPGLGKICGSSFCAEATGWPVRSNTIARVLVVPWSMARMCLAAIGPRLQPLSARGRWRSPRPRAAPT